ncbi:GATA zinc finger domain-containing protein 1-like [Limulus polyphemus]|uniref:GATA zinc finger domain-containing protein 1 n=1 Tax=Limulus polyphemus TaxID=6850 RepID=A0ABM1B9M9_LIMPO|nr:GATA zinc finger domain-containing protein 1-like [Limulus polyphemus]
MPFGVKPQCTTCRTTVSTMWRKNDRGDVLCNSCGVRAFSQESSDGDKKGNGNNGTCPFTLRKSTRAKSSKFKQQAPLKSTNPKGKGRRIIFKRSTTKAPTSVASPVTSDCVYYKGFYYQVGDIVSVVDVEGDVYYAQIRGLLQDQYCEKSAVLSWLIPTQSSPKDYFDPATYIIGPEEDIPRKLDCLEFVCNAPAEYFKAHHSPYPTQPSRPEMCFIWTRIGPQIKPLPSQEEVFGIS